MNKKPKNTSRELSDILAYVEQLDQADIVKVPQGSKTRITDSENVFVLMK